MLAAEAAAAGPHRQLRQRKLRTQRPAQISAVTAPPMLVLFHLTPSRNSARGAFDRALLDHILAMVSPQAASIQVSQHSS